MSKVHVGETYQLRNYNGRVCVISTVYIDDIHGIMVVLRDDVFLEDRVITKGAVLGLSISDLIVDGDNADFEYLLHSMNEVI